VSPAPPEILPALLGANPLRYGEALDAVAEAGCEWVHLDVMDGQFTTEITFGSRLLAALAETGRARLDVHLQTAAPAELVPAFAAAGAERIAIHAEAVEDPHAAMSAVRATGAEACIALNPESPLPEDGLLEAVDAVLLMTSQPGTSAFEPDVLPKIARLCSRLEAHDLEMPIIADGGVTAANARTLAQVGASALVAASAVFAHPQGPGEGVKSLRDATV
jgi:ribulose-phosphate 3-epimerase